MSAPRTNIDKQKRRHLTPLVGVVLAVAFGFFMFLLWMFDVFESAEEPGISDDATQETSPTGSDDAVTVEADESDGTAGPDSANGNSETTAGE